MFHCQVPQSLIGEFEHAFVHQGMLLRSKKRCMCCNGARLLMCLQTM